MSIDRLFANLGTLYIMWPIQLQILKLLRLTV